MTEEQLEHERCGDDDYNVISHFYRAKECTLIFPFIFVMKEGTPLNLGGV